MKPQDAFKELINDLKPLFKSCNYSRKGNSFYFLKKGNIGLIAFQKSRSSNTSKVTFTINMGIYSHTVANFFTPDRIKLHPSIADCHWKERVGEKSPPFQEKWWSIDAQTSITELGNELDSYLRKSIVEIDEYISDSDLQSLWASGQAPGLSNVHRLINLSILLKQAGDIIQLKAVKSELKRISEDTSLEFIAKQHLMSL